MISLKEVVAKYPECLESSIRLRGYLTDLYPEERARIKIVTTIFDCGIAEKIKRGASNQLALAAYVDRLENDYGYSQKLSRECLRLWCEVYSAPTKKQKKTAEKQKAIPSSNTQSKSKPPKSTQAPKPVRPSKPTKTAQHVKEQAEFEIQGELLVRYNGNESNLVIPNGVTRIGRFSFFNCDNLIAIIIPNNVTEIGNYAFYGCTNLESITIPRGVSKIGSFAFNGCHKLIIYTPHNSAAEKYAKSYSIPLQEYMNPTNSATAKNPIPLPTTQTKSEPAKQTQIPKPVQPLKPSQSAQQANTQAEFEISDGVLIKYKGKGGNVTIPSSVKKVGDFAFYNCNNLTSVFIPKHVNKIGKAAFYGCSNLKKVLIYRSQVRIEAMAFSCCDGLSICARRGSSAEGYAKAHSIPFSPL